MALLGGTALRGCLGIGLLALAGVAVTVTPAAAIDPNTLPQGGQVVGGSATIQQTAPARLDIKQHTDRAVINWQSFDIGSAAHTDFQQPSSSAIAVNRITNGNPTQILGKLTANGRVMVLNPNGVLFGQSAKVDVSGLIASTGNIDDAKFMRGDKHLALTGPASGGAVINQGDITVKQGGLAAFVAPSVANSGTIRARLGKVELAGASKVTLDLYGDGLVEIAVDGKSKAGGTLVANAGKIIADGGRVDLSAAAARDVADDVINMSGVVQAHGVEVKGGEIVLKGSGGTTTVSGTLDASARQAGGTGGSVKVLGDKVAVADGATIDASGDAGGGTVLVGGNFQGKGSEPNAEETTVAKGARLAADALGTGNGGMVVAWADGTTRFDGTASAKGGASGGDGGTVETSGKRSLKVGDTAKVDTSAPAGNTGTWLLDPDSLTIAESGADVTTTGSIVTGLLTNNVTVQANHSITVADAIDSSSQSNSNQLQFQDGDGGNDLVVNLNAGITLGNGQTLTGDASTVNVGSAGRIQNGVDIGAANSTVNVAAGSYTEQVTLDKTGMTLAGADGAKLIVPDAAQVNGIDIKANDVTVSGMEIAGPVTSSYKTYAWGSNISRGIAVHNGITGFTLSGNDIHDVRNGILIDGRNSTGSVTGNTIDNTKSGISVQYTDASGITISGNAEGSNGNEWGLNLHLNGHYDGSTVISNSTPISDAPTASWQQALLDLGTNNAGWSVQDQAYTSSNRTRVEVATTGSAGNQGSALTPIDTIQGGIDAVVAGGRVNVAAGDYTPSSVAYDPAAFGGGSTTNGQILVDKAVTINGATGATVNVATPASTALADRTLGFTVAADDVSINGFKIVGPLAGEDYRTTDFAQLGYIYGVFVDDGVKGSRLTNNTMYGVRTGVSYEGDNGTSGSGQTAYATGNDIYNTRGAFLLRSTGVGLSNNSFGSVHNEWDLTLLAGLQDGDLFTSPFTSETQYGADMMALSNANNGMTIADRRYGEGGIITQQYETQAASESDPTTKATLEAKATQAAGFANRSHVQVKLGADNTPSSSIGETRGNGFGTYRLPIDTIQHGVDAVVAGGEVDVQSGTYNESVSVNKALTMKGAGTGQTIIDPTTGNAVTISGNIGSTANVDISGFTFQNAPGSGVAVAADTTLKQLTIQHSAFNSNGTFGFRLDGNSTTGSNVAKVELSNDTFSANGSTYTEATSLGRGDINFNYFTNDATLQNVDVAGYGTGGGAHIGIQFRGTTNNIVDAGNIVFDNVSVTGNYRRPDKTYVSGSETKNYGTWNPGGPGDAMHLLEYASVGNISFNDVTLAPTIGHGLFAEGLGTTLNLGNTTFGAPNTTITGSVTPTLSYNIVSGQNGANNVRTNIDATGATFTGADKSTLAGNFAIEDRVAHRTDRADLGLVTWKAGNVYVTANSGSIQRGIDAASAGDTINVADGTYGTIGTSIGGPANLKILAAGSGAVIDGSDASTAPARLVDLRADGTEFRGFTIKGPGADNSTHVGVSLVGRNLTVADNTIRDVLTGIQTNTQYAAGDNTISGNTVTANYGVSLQNTGNTISDNKVTAAVEGLGILPGANTLTGNTFDIASGGEALNLYDSAVASTLATSDNKVTIAGGAKLQTAADLAGTDGTLTLGAGSYDGGLEITKSGLTVTGAGAGSTKITSGTTDSLVTRANTEVSFNRSAYGDGITVDGASNVSLSGFSLAGFEYAFTAQGSADNLKLDNLTFDNNFTGVWVGDRQNNAPTSADNFRVTNTTIQNGIYGVYTQNWLDSGTNTARTSFANALFRNVKVDGLTAKGFYIEAARNLELNTVTVANSGNFGTQLSNTPNARKYGTGIDINLKYDDFGTLAFNNVTVSNSGNSSGDKVTGAGVTIKTRGVAGDSSSYTPRPASLTSVTFSGGSIKGSPGDGLRVETLRTASGGQPTVKLDGTEFQNNGTAIRVGKTNINAGAAKLIGATNTREWEARVYDSLDDPTLGRVSRPTTLPVPVDTLPPVVTKATPPPPSPPPPPPPPPPPQQVANSVPAGTMFNLMPTAAGGVGGGGAPQPKVYVTNNTANVGNLIGGGNVVVLDLSSGIGTFSSVANLTPPAAPAAPPVPATPAAAPTAPTAPSPGSAGGTGGGGGLPPLPSNGPSLDGGGPTPTPSGGTTPTGGTGPTAGATQPGGGQGAGNGQDNGNGNDQGNGQGTGNDQNQPGNQGQTQGQTQGQGQ